MKKTYNGLSNKAGIYKIVNVVNKKAYYGKCSKFSTRVCQHIKALNAGTHFNKHLQRDWGKHSPESFEFIAIESIETEEERRTAEQTLIDKHFDGGKKCYNMKKTVIISPSATGYKSIRTTEQRRECMLGKNTRKHTPEENEAMGVIKRGVKLSPEHCAAIGAGGKGKIISPEHRAAIGAFQKGKIVSPETCAKIKAGHLARSAKRFEETLHTVMELYLSITK